MGKSKQPNELSSSLVPFLTDLAARGKVGTWKTGGPAGREPVGGMKGLYDFIGKRDAEKNGLKLQDGEINPFLFSASSGDSGSPPKQMYEYWSSDAMPTLPKDMRDQYDIVFAGSRPFDPNDAVYNPKFGYGLVNTDDQNIWQFVPKKVKDEKPKKVKPVEEAPVVEEDSDRPVSIGTLSYNNPNAFLGQYIRSIGNAPA